MAHESVSRREFAVRASALLIPGALTSPPAQHEQGAPLPRAAIPSSGQRIARVGLGTWQTFDVGSDASRRRELADTLRVFVESGADVIDTSPMYGSSEEVLGALVESAGVRDRLFVATKVWTTGTDAGIRQVDDSLRKLRTTRAELIQIHNLVDWRTQLRTLRRWKDEGRVRYIGITHYVDSAFDTVASIVRDEPLDFVQLNLSLDEPEAASSMLALCARRKVAFIANRPFGGGGALGRVRGKPLPDWAAEQGIGSWAQMLLKWILSHEEVTCAIPGTGNPHHLADNLNAARGVPLDSRLRGRIEQFWRSL